MLIKDTKKDARNYKRRKGGCPVPERRFYIMAGFLKRPDFWGNNGRFS
ncbi:MAG: hypothetical protein AAF490_02885 [Chloroflexota bacterium]